MDETSTYLKVRLDWLVEEAPAIAVSMHAVISAFLEAGFAIEHAFEMSQTTYKHVLSEFDL